MQISRVKIGQRDFNIVFNSFFFDNRDSIALITILIFIGKEIGIKQIRNEAIFRFSFPVRGKGSRCLSREVSDESKCRDVSVQNVFILPCVSPRS